MITSRLTLMAVAAISLAACSQDDAATGGEALPEGMYPLEIGAVTIGVEGGEAQPWGAKTRVEENSSGNASVWSGGEEIGVTLAGTLADGTTAYTSSGTYTVASNGR